MISSDRLLLKIANWDKELDLHFSLSSDPELMRYIRDPETDKAIFAHKMQKYAQYNRRFPALGVRSVYLKSNNTYIGNCILRHVELNPENAYEIGYMIKKEYWGKGYASEVAAALCAFVQEKLMGKSIVAFTDFENVASQKVLLKNNFCFSGTQVVEGDLCKRFLKKGKEDPMI